MFWIIVLFITALDPRSPSGSSDSQKLHSKYTGLLAIALRTRPTSRTLVHNDWVLCQSL